MTPIGQTDRHEEDHPMNIPEDLNSWHPTDIELWLNMLANDPAVSESEYEAALQAVDAAG